MRRTVAHAHIVGSIQVSKVNSGSDEETIRSEDSNAPTTVHHQSLKKGLHRQKLEAIGGLVDTPIPPSFLEYHPTQPKLVRDGWLMGYTPVKLPVHRRLARRTER